MSQRTKKDKGRAGESWNQAAEHARQHQDGAESEDKHLFPDHELDLDRSQRLLKQRRGGQSHFDCIERARLFRIPSRTPAS